MIASQQDDLLRILELQGHEKTNDFQTVLTLVDVIAKEEIVEGVDVSVDRIVGSFPNVEKSHQVYVLSVNVTEYFDRWSNFFDDYWLSCKNVGALVGKLNNMLFLAGELRAGFQLLTFFRL